LEGLIAEGLGIILRFWHYSLFIVSALLLRSQKLFVYCVFQTFIHICILITGMYSSDSSPEFGHSTQDFGV